MVNVKNNIDRVFAIELKAWCYGIERYPGEVYPGLVHAIVRELGPIIQEAIVNHYAFNILETAETISKAAKYLVHQKEVAFSILAYFPLPGTLDEDAQFVMAQIIDQVEAEYGGALERLKKKWQYE
ncbi:MAG: hypothetical protein KDD62_06110, partial [Bdellovibrionales bacterium]|nr:hypothetical protein [Bdellovibrionales bacterium]